MTGMAERFSKFAEMRDRPPDEATSYWTGGPTEVGDRTWFVSQLSGCTAFETDEGLVLVDTGMRMAAPLMAGEMRRVTRAPVHTAVYTHGHVDHAYGLDRFLVDGQEPPVVIAHEAMADRFARYEATSGHNNAINVRQFGGIVPDGGADLFHAPPVEPTLYYSGERLDIEVGGVAFELHHDRGETDDHTWVWCPERGVLCTGDLFIWTIPNAGNPQKVQRYPWDWSRALRRMAALEPRTLCPGHGGPIVDDPGKINHMLVSTADYVERIVSQAIDALNDGSPPHVDVVHRVEIPESDLPWLQVIYDDPEFLVRSVLRHYGGWWTGRPSELKPAPREDLAAEIGRLAGGVDVLALRARELAEQGDVRLACHLADLALEADPANPEAQQAVVDVYGRRSEEDPGLMAANIYASAVAYAQAGRPFR